MRVYAENGVLMIIVKEYTLPPPDTREVLRYMGVKGEGEELFSLIRRACDELLSGISARVCYTELSASVNGDTVNIGGAECISTGLATRISGAGSVIVFVATVGALADRLIARYSRVSPSLSLAVSALATERVEALCDLFSREIAEQKNGEGFDTRARFSPGYGNLSLEFQRDIFRILSPEGKIGVSLTDGLLMTPTKSVSAIIGITERVG